MEQLRKDMSEVIFLEGLNAQRIDKLGENLMTLRDTLAQFSTSIATQAQVLSGFRELYAREISFIHQALDDLKESLDEIKEITISDKDKISAVEKDIAVAQGSVKSIVMTWSGFIALISFMADKIIDLFAKR